MTTNVKQLATKIRSSFWFLPGCLIVGALGLSWLMVEIDFLIGYRIDEKARSWNIFIGPAGARSLLNTLAGSMITVASLVFSLTLIALTMAASNLGPRLIVFFMRDRITQLSLGVFIATFLYAIMTLLTIRDGDTGAFVPYASLLVGIILSVLSYSWLIFFINRVARQIQADNVVAELARDLERSVRQTLDEAEPDPYPDDETKMPDTGEQAWYLRAAETGYIQMIHRDELMRLAESGDVRVQLSHRAGHFVIEGEIVGKVVPDPAHDEAESLRLGRTIRIGRQRTLGQDVEFAILQVVDVAIRALSPGINDHNTAVAAIDRLTGALASIFAMGLPKRVLRDSNGAPRIWTDPVTYGGMVASAFNEIRQNARGNVAVTIRLMDALTTLAGVARNQHQRDALARQADSIIDGAREAIPDERDLEDLEDRCRNFNRVRDEAAGNGSRPEGEEETPAAD